MHLFFLVLGIFSSSVIASGAIYPPVTVPMALQQVSPHVYLVQGQAGVASDNEGFISNAGVVITDEGIVIIDSLGTPSLAKTLLDKVREISDRPVVRVIVSHYHADHVCTWPSAELHNEVFMSQVITMILPVVLVTSNINSG